jgi:hypothetical protein
VYGGGAPVSRLGHTPNTRIGGKIEPKKQNPHHHPLFLAPHPPDLAKTTSFFSYENQKSKFASDTLEGLFGQFAETVCHGTHFVTNPFIHFSPQ